RGAGFLGLKIPYGRTASGIDTAAHLGGLAAGFLCGLVLSQPLTPAAAAGRRARNVVVAGGGLALVIGGGFSLSFVESNLGAVLTEIERFAEVEKQVLATF